MYIQHGSIATKEKIEGQSPKRKRESSCVWQHFKNPEDKTTVEEDCGKTLKTAANTTNLIDHLKRIHSNYSVCEIDNMSPRLDSFMQRNEEYPSESQQKKSLGKYVMRKDGWTFRAKEAYITVICHFVSKKFELDSAALSTASLVTPTNHSAINIADTLRLVLNEWGFFS